MGLPRNTVPVLMIDGRRVQGSREISRELNRLCPNPRLFPDNPEKRRAVEDAERWGEEELQHPIRQVSLWAMRANRAPIRSYIGIRSWASPPGSAARLAPRFIDRGVRVNEATDEAVRDNFAALDSMLGEVEKRIDAGVLDGEELNAADFQIGGRC